MENETSLHKTKWWHFYNQQKKTTLCFHFLQTSFSHFLFLEWTWQEAFLRSCKDNLDKDYRNWKKKNKKDKENSIVFPTFFLCSLGFQRDVQHFHLMFIILLLFKDLFHCVSLKGILKRLERTTKITKKLWGNIILKSLEER